MNAGDPGRVSRSCSTSDARRVTLVTNPVLSHEWRKDWKVLTRSRTYPWSWCRYLMLCTRHFSGTIFIGYIQSKTIWNQNHVKVFESTKTKEHKSAKVTYTWGGGRGENLNFINNYIFWKWNRIKWYLISTTDSVDDKTVSTDIYS